MLSIFFSCESRQKVGNNIRYRLESPDQKHTLPPVLKEVSGISFTDDDANLLCIDDNYGKIFYLNPADAKIQSVKEFEGEGDYEDIAVTASAVWSLRSDGTLFETTPDSTIKHESFLTTASNTEALCYDSKNNRLLVMQKDRSVSGNESVKECYAFDLRTKTFSETPVFRLTYDQFKPFTGGQSKKFRFKPSGMAIHPESGELYIISGTARAMAVTDMEGHIKDVSWLRKDIFAQPEGICFDSASNLWISNEGRKGEPDIVMFKQQKK